MTIRYIEEEPQPDGEAYLPSVNFDRVRRDGVELVSVQIAGSDDELMGDRQVLIDYFTDIVTSLYAMEAAITEFPVPHHRMVSGILVPEHDDDVELVELVSREQQIAEAIDAEVAAYDQEEE